MTSLTWTEKFSNHSLNLDVVMCHVIWEDGCFKASVVGKGKTLKLKEDFSSLDLAKSQCLKVAKKMILKSLEALNTLEA